MATLFNAFEIPESTVQKGTGQSYTVPAGYYAWIRANVRAGGTFSINGAIVMGSNDVDTTWQQASFSGTGRLQSSYWSSATGTPVDGSIQPTTTTAHSRAQTASGGGDYKVPAATTMTCSGSASYHVELYKMPGT